MNRETFRLSQKELQRVAVISSCIKGDLACARAAELLDLTPRQVKRLKARYRLGSAAALAHASRGRPSPRRLPSAPAPAFSIWPARATRASTITISARNSVRSKV